MMLPATNPDDATSSDDARPAPSAPLGFSGVPASNPLPPLQPIESVTPPPAHAVAPPSPVVETPVVETPVVETPVVETPVVETPVVEVPDAPEPVVPAAADPMVRVDWVPLADDLLPAAPRSLRPLSSLGVGTPKPGFLARLRRNRDDALVVAEVVSEPDPESDVFGIGSAPAPTLPVVAAMPVAPVASGTPDDRESYAFWSQDRAPRDFSDVMALPERPLDGAPDA
ncbi:MAG TPA: hypothetical protein VFZ83_04640 [Acidimicrobiia bacterium]|nr:hypothetical protein [Acidimicrobiia bacterium]